jgi:hypothetical protein
VIIIYLFSKLFCLVELVNTERLPEESCRREEEAAALATAEEEKSKAEEALVAPSSVTTEAGL